MAAFGMAVPNMPRGRSRTRSSGERRSKRTDGGTRTRTIACGPAAGRCSGSGRTNLRPRPPKPSRAWSPRPTRSIALRRPVRTRRTEKEDGHHMGVQNERQTETYRARPEPGQLVEVRRRQWVVADVDAAGLEPGIPQHCVTLSSIDEDGLGEE